MPEPYGPEHALAILRNILLNDGRLKIRNHCYDQMERRTVDDLDIKKVLLETGAISSGPKLDEKHRKYSIKWRVWILKESLYRFWLISSKEIGWSLS